MKLRTTREIQEFIVHPRSQQVLRKAAQGTTTPEDIQKLVLNSVFGSHVFRGSEGRKLRTILNRTTQTMKGNRLRKLGRTLLEASRRLNWTIWALEPDKLHRLKDEERETALHILKNTVQRFYSTGKRLSEGKMQKR